MIRRLHLGYAVEFEERPARSARHAHAMWSGDARIVIRCVRCDTSQRVSIGAAEIQSVDPMNNHCLSTIADGIVHMCPSGRAAMDEFEDHPCWPSALANGVDVDAPAHEQYEAMAMAFAKLAAQTRSVS